MFLVIGSCAIKFAVVWVSGAVVLRGFAFEVLSVFIAWLWVLIILLLFWILWVVLVWVLWVYWFGLVVDACSGGVL